MLKGFVSGEEKDIKRITMKTRNLFDVSKLSEGTAGKYLSSDGTETDNGAWAITPFIPVNGDYVTLYGPVGNSPSIGVYDENLQFVRGEAYQNHATNTISIQGAAYVRFSLAPASQEHLDAMLNYGQTALPYEPYGYQEGWEVRDSQDRLIWGREDELQTATGTLPFKGYGLPVKVKSLLGNAVQNGTPTPANITIPEMCGVMTGNLWDPDSRVTNQVGQPGWGVRLPAGTYTITNNSSVSVYWRDGYDSTQATTFAQAGATASKTAQNEMVAWCASSQSSIMLNTGSTELPFEPFGYKIPISCGGETTPVYLGQVSTVRRVKKLVFDGTETDWIASTTSGGDIAFRLNFSPNAKNQSNAISSHYINSTQGGTRFFIGSGLYAIFFVDVSYETLADWKAYLASEYAEGHPVTIWYVLATEQTGIVNEPLCKISTYADELNGTVATLPEIQTTTGQNTLTVDTTLAPSSLTIKGHIKELT